MHRIIGFLAIALCFVWASCARQRPEPPFTLKQVGTNVWAAIDNPKATKPASANAGFVVGDDGVVVIDTFFTEDAATHLLGEIRQRTKLPVKYVVNTHYHIDHVAGNTVLARQGATILAQRHVRGWIHSENLRLIGDFLTPELKALTESIAAPGIDYDGVTHLHLGARTIQVRSLQGHTGGDSIVVVPDVKVAFLGDLFWRNMLPNLIDASTQTWVETLDAIAAMNEPGFTFVPGHGDVGDVRDVTAFRDYLTTLRGLVAEARTRGESGDALAQSNVPKLKEKFASWDFAEPLAKMNVLQTDAEMDGTKRVPAAID
jgi:glyoxylase-like metal-dependent hydrolase (beta-lactamase superfamily II)